MNKEAQQQLSELQDIVTLGLPLTQEYITALVQIYHASTKQPKARAIRKVIWDLLKITDNSKSEWINPLMLNLIKFSIEQCKSADIIK